jgi:hypothetical protein
MALSRYVLMVELICRPYDQVWDIGKGDHNIPFVHGRDQTSDLVVGEERWDNI